MMSLPVLSLPALRTQIPQSTPAISDCTSFPRSQEQGFRCHRDSVGICWHLPSKPPRLVVFVSVKYKLHILSHDGILSLQTTFIACPQAL